MTLPLIMATYMIKGVLSVINDNSMEILWQSDKLLHANNLQRIRGELKRNSEKMIQKNVGELHCLNQNEPGYFIIIIITMSIIVIAFFLLLLLLVVVVVVVVVLLLLILLLLLSLLLLSLIFYHYLYFWIFQQDLFNKIYCY